MTSLANYNNGTETGYGPVVFQDLVVSGFYGPGAWAAWYITLIASWAPILRDDYTHNLHFITHALYTNWAAIDALQYLSLDRRLDKLASDVEELYRQWREKSPIAHDLDDSEKKLHFEAVLEITRGIRGDKGNITGTRTWIPKHWPKIEVGSPEWMIDQLSQDKHKTHHQHLQTQLVAHKKTWHQLYSLWAQSCASLVVLNHGTLHAFAQLLVCAWKTYKTTCSETTESLRSRNLIILLGLSLPSMLLWGSILWMEHGVVDASPGIVGVLFVTFFIPHWKEDLLVFLPRLGYIFEKTAGVLCLSVLITSLSRWVITLVAVSSETAHMEVALKCFFMPCTPIKIMEMDQAFALCVALFCFLYECGSWFLKLLKFLGFHFENF